MASNPLGVGFKIKEVFFDRKGVINSLTKEKRKFLSKFGAFVRKRAKSSIRPGGKKKVGSLPGAPPRSQTGTLKRGIFFGFDRVAESVVIGPVVFPEAKGGAKALEALEYGGGSITFDEIRTFQSGRDKRGRFRKAIRQRTGRRLTKRIAARPFMMPAFEEEKQNISNIWRAANP